MDLKRWQEAFNSCKRLSELFPDESWIWNNRGWTLQNVGRYREALECYDKGLSLAPDDDTLKLNSAAVLKLLAACACIPWSIAAR